MLQTYASHKICQVQSSDLQIAHRNEVETIDKYTKPARCHGSCDYIGLNMPSSKTGQQKGKRFSFHIPTKAIEV